VTRMGDVMASPNMIALLQGLEVTSLNRDAEHTDFDLDLLVIFSE
jgi:hypothetical protein